MFFIVHKLIEINTFNKLLNIFAGLNYIFQE